MKFIKRVFSKIFFLHFKLIYESLISYDKRRENSCCCVMAFTTELNPFIPVDTALVFTLLTSIFSCIITFRCLNINSVHSGIIQNNKSILNFHVFKTWHIFSINLNLGAYT